MNSWTLSLMGSVNVDIIEINLFLMLRHIDTVEDYILTNVENLNHNQFFSETTIQHIQLLHKSLWMEKYQLSELEYKLVTRLIDVHSITLADLTRFLKDHQLATPLVVGWMHHLIQKLHRDGQWFIETRPHPSGSEYCWEPVRKDWNV